jgi:tetratricopeptide (TPR) repeat protein/class 3 adenylate cyclase
MLGMPQGIVTFLFTDIEGSTRLWECFPEPMWEAFAIQEHIIRSTSAQHGGFVYKMIGDAFQIAFETALQALVTAIDIQRSLHGVAWGPTGQLRVRMALHSGTTEVRINDYVGPMLNRLARILEAGHGGQILVSSETAQLLHASLPNGVALDDLGEHYLRDLTEPPRIFQVTAGGLPARFPVLTSLGTHLYAHPQLGRAMVPPIAPLPPGSRMPFPPNPHFIGRNDELLLLAAALHGGERVAISPRAAATGLGGIGKTSLAVEFVHRYGRYFTGGVFWLSFANPRGIPTEIAACGGSDFLNLETSFGMLTLEEQVKRVQVAWQQPIPRLLIFDNCEYPQLVQQWCPTQSGCRILITSRRASWPSTLDIATQTLDVLPRPMSSALLRNLAPRLTDDEAAAVADALGDFPLALHLAGSFLARYPRMSAATYLDQLRHRPLLDHPSLQSSASGHLPTSHDAHVHRTFALSHTRLNSASMVDVQARNMLARVACLAPGERIPTAVLIDALGAPGNEFDVHDALARVIDFGFLDVIGESVRAHRLLHAFLSSAAAIDQACRDCEVVLLRHAAAINAAGYPRAMQPLLPHLRWCTRDAAQRTDALMAELCETLALHLHTIGDYAAARQLFERALAINEQALGVDHPTTAHTLNSLADLLRAMGNPDAAMPLAKRALAINEQVHGPDHPATAQSLNNLAGLLYAAGAAVAATPLVERALAINEQALGPDHPLVAQTLAYLAYLLEAQGRYTLAEPFACRALAINEHILGSTHPTVAQSLNNLASLLTAQARYDEARPLYQRALVINEQALGSMHLATAQTLNNLAVSLILETRYAEAEALARQSIAIYTDVVGPRHAVTARSMGTLAEVLRLRRNYEAARPFAEQAVAICQEELGSDHPLTAIHLDYHARLLGDRGDYEAARLAFEQALAINERTGGPEHPRTALNLHHLALLLRDGGERPLACTLLARAYAINKRVLGPHHPATQRTYADLAACRTSDAQSSSDA